jgi:hypothetical protein
MGRADGHPGILARHRPPNAKSAGDDVMLDWVLSLLLALGLAAGGIAGVGNAQNHQAQAPNDSAPVPETTDLGATDVADRLGDLALMISEKLSAAADKAASQAQEALADAADAAAAGLAKASDAVTNAGAPAAVPPGPPSDLPGPGDHPGH